MTCGERTLQIIHNALKGYGLEPELYQIKYTIFGVFFLLLSGVMTPLNNKKHFK
jgi:hypothetical protein